MCRSKALEFTEDNVYPSTFMTYSLFVTDLTSVAFFVLVGGCVEAGGNRDNQQVRLTARYDGHKLPRHTRSSIQASDLCKQIFLSASVILLIF